MVKSFFIVVPRDFKPDSSDSRSFQLSLTPVNIWRMFLFSINFFNVFI